MIIKIIGWYVATDGSQVCRRLPLPRNGRKNGTSLAHAEPPLDASFLAGIKEEAVVGPGIGVENH